MASRRKSLTARQQLMRWTLWAVTAVALHIGTLALIIWIGTLLPDPKLDRLKRPMEVTWIQPRPRAPTPTPQPPKPPPRPPKVPPVAKREPPQAVQPPQPSVQAPPPQPVRPPPPKPPEVKEPPKAAVIPQPPQPVQKPPEPKKEEEKKEEQKEKAQMPKERHKMVEVDDDKNLVDEPPADAEFWSDKNRSVAEQTRDERSNLEKQMNGKASQSDKSEDTQSPEVGGEDEQVHQLEKAEASTLEKTNADPTTHSGDKDKAVGLIIGERGQQGSRGESGDGGQEGKPGTLSMRNIQGRGAPGMDHSINVAPSPGANDDAPEVSMSKTPGDGGKTGESGREGTPGKPGRRGPKLALNMDTYERVVGPDKYRDEIEVSKRQKSHKKGRWEKKLDSIHSSLENFIPEVKPGNQTALGTRAAPFAVYIARTHRKIHELWGFGFLSDLDLKSPSNPMNNRDLKVTMEIVLNADGTVDNVKIVKGSGVLTFDVAAIDSVMSAGPFEKPPPEIVSANGKLYMHWTFHRDERQCSPYFADPFILDNPTPGNEKRGLPEPAEEVARRKQLERISRDGSPTKPGAAMPHVTREQLPEGDAPAAARANANLPAPDEPAAQDAALRWANAFEAGDIGGLVAASGVPFRVGGAVGPTDQAELSTMWHGLLGELPTRDIKEWKLMSSAGYRAVFGRLPKGADDGKLLLAIKLGKDVLTLEVGPGADGKVKVIGLYR